MLKIKAQDVTAQFRKTLQHASSADLVLSSEAVDERKLTVKTISQAALLVDAAARRDRESASPLHPDPEPVPQPEPAAGSAEESQATDEDRKDTPTTPLRDHPPGIGGAQAETEPRLRADTAISELKHSADATRDRLSGDTRGEVVTEEGVPSVKNT